MMGVARTVPVVGLVGGVGSGKSFVAAALAARRRVAVIAADPIGHDVLKLPGVKAQLRRVFGSGVFTEHGEIDRLQMARLVFGNDPQTRDRRSQLEAITHPEITREVRQQITALQTQPGLEAILIDAALLLEAGWKSLCDRVVFVESRETDRQQRVAHSRGWSADELARREASQWPLERKRSASDAVVHNLGPRQGADELERLLDGWCRDWNTANLPTRSDQSAGAAQRGCDAS